MNESELRIEAFRASHQVKLVEGEMEGTAVTEVPDGTFGYSYSPDIGSGTPIFRRKSYRSFEVHRGDTGEIYFIGYVTPEQQEKLDSSDDYVELDLYPDAFEQATAPVSIPFARIINKNLRPERTDGNPLPMKVGPEQG